MDRKKEILFGIITVGITLFVCFIVAEIIFRVLPVNEGMRSRPVTFEQPVLTYEPDEQVIWSRDWNFSVVNRLRVNAQGFVNKYDYVPGVDTPVLAVIGDSYIEAAMVPYEETLFGRLEAEARANYNGRFKVYSFGASGAPLSQYLVYAQHAKDNYNVQGMVFAIIGNDFDESLPAYRFQETFHQFREAGDGTLELFLPREYHSSMMRKIVRHSAVARYLFFNAQLWQALHRVKALLSVNSNEDRDFVGNTAADMTPERLSDSQAAIDAFFNLLPTYTGLSPDKIAFIVDAPRPEIYEVETPSNLEESYFTIMRNYFMAQARIKGYAVMDAAPFFWRQHKETGVRFEFPTDGHWSGVGHGAAYEMVQGSEFYERFLSSVSKR